MKLKGWNGTSWNNVAVGSSAHSYYGLKSRNLSSYTTDVLRKLDPDETFLDSVTSNYQLTIG
jgi:hypothetical protein